MSQTGRGGPGNGKTLRLQLIVCKVLQREAYYCAARSPNVVDIVLMEQGLHDTPDRLREEVQKALRQTRDIQDRPFDASLLGYGLCSNGTVGLTAEIPVVIPRGHDCITLLLGAKERYQQYFDSHRGIYWYSPGWIESGKQPGRHWATYVDWGLVDADDYKAYTKECADFLGWNYDELRGDSGLMQRFVDGLWSDEEFLVVEPGQRIAEDVTNEGIIKAE